MSASIGVGGGKGKEEVSSPAADTLAGLASQFASETTGVRTGLIDALQQVLQTGGTTIPLISRSVEASKQASSNAQRTTEAELAQSGNAGTPFGEMIMSTLRQQGEQAAGQTSQSLAQQIFNMIPNFILGQSQTALSGLAGAIPGMNTTNAKGLSMGTSAGFGG